MAAIYEYRSFWGEMTRAMTGSDTVRVEKYRALYRKNFFPLIGTISNHWHLQFETRFGI
jgi:hypothetical protein